ncbi:MAG: hypothetical protein ACK42D_04165 [Candidatus Paceibacteria bacterium]
MQKDYDIALRAFSKYLKLQSQRKLPVGKLLDHFLRSWLAQNHVRVRYQIDSRPPHEVISLSEFIKSNIRQTWTEKAKETRKKTKEREKKIKDEKRQLTLPI